MTLGEFRKATELLPDDISIFIDNPDNEYECFGMLTVRYIHCINTNKTVIKILAIRHLEKEQSNAPE